jgi:short-subunit dehydrogenase
MRDEVVLVTGGSSGIGLAAARRFAGEGARVVLVARGEPALRDAAAGIGPAARALPADITSPGSVHDLAEAVRREEGRLDVLVNAAGQFEIGPFEQTGPEALERLMRVNLHAAVGMIHACLPLLRLGARRSIVNLSSVAGKLVPPYFAAYSASKFALAAYSHSIRQELRSEGFHVGVVYPGPVATAMIEGKIGTSHYPRLPGVPVLQADDVARDILRCVRRRSAEVVSPRRMAGTIRLAASLPLVVDRLYRLYVRRAERERGGAADLA